MFSSKETIVDSAVNRQLQNTLKLETDIESKEFDNKSAAIEKCWIDHDFQDMKTNTSEFYFTKKITGSLEHISQCRKQIRAHTPNACKFLGGRVIFKSHQPNWACKRHRKWKMVHLAFVLDGQRSDIHREPIVARRDSIAPCGYASRATASKPLLIEERNHTPRR